MTATDVRTRRLAATEAPPSVRTATTILYILVGLAVVRPIAFLAVAAVSLARGNAFDRELIPVAGISVGAVLLGWFYLLLIRKTRKGRRWAWLTLLMMLGLVAFVGFLVMTGVSNGAAIGMAMMAVALILMGLLALPRRAREYYRRFTG
jgi:NADH:ubiquinone oxidoreductase subunit 2 (subunit N)